MEVPLPSGCGMPRGTAGRDDRLQNPASALGQGSDSGLEKNSAQSFCERRLAPPKSRSLVSPDGQPQLSADDRAVRAFASRHGHSLLSGMVPDALHRPAAVHGVDVFHLQLLSGFAKGIISQKLAAFVALSSAAHGPGDWPDYH